MRRPGRVLAVFILLAVLAGCATTNTTGGTKPPAPPTPPQITVAQTMLALSDALQAADKALIACSGVNKCSAGDVTAAQNVIVAIAMVGKQIDAELVSSDPWAVQKTVILKDVAQAGITQLSARVSPTTQLVIAGAVALFNNISSAVGGPTL